MRVRVYVSAVTVSLLSVLTVREIDRQAVVPVVDVVNTQLPREVRVLLPGQLCDNLQGTLMWYVKALLETPYHVRLELQDSIVRTREALRNAGCG